MRIKADTIERYLDKNAENTARFVLARARQPLKTLYSSAVVVPIFDETPLCLDRLVRAIEEPKTSSCRLVIAVFNAPSSAAPDQRERTTRLMKALRARGPSSEPFGSRSMTLVEAPFRSICGTPRAIDLLVVDATAGEFGLRPKEGVGRARKLGADLALALFVRGSLQSPMLGCTDADAQLPPSYFSELEAKQQASALLFPFAHQKSNDFALDLGMAQLEATFRYYVLGLSYAGSPYAYQSLGSAMAVSLPHYAAVRGFPNRQAGEDFHLLSKLAQLQDLRRVKIDEIQIFTRVSARVPFGTGPRLAQWLEQHHDKRTSMLTYDPQIFVALKQFLERMKQAAMLGDLDSEPRLHAVDHEVESAFARLLPSLATCPSDAHRLRRVHEQFDALATLQFIHRQSGGHFPHVGLDVALRRIGLEVAGGAPEAALNSWDATLSQLRALEAALPPWVGPHMGSREALNFRMNWEGDSPSFHTSDAG